LSERVSGTARPKSSTAAVSMTIAGSNRAARGPTTATATPATPGPSTFAATKVPESAAFDRSHNALGTMTGHRDRPPTLLSGAVSDPADTTIIRTEVGRVWSSDSTPIKVMQVEATT
jgi:hypothetical protein